MLGIFVFQRKSYRGRSKEGDFRWRNRGKQVKDPLGKDATMFPLHHDIRIGNDVTHILDRLKQQQKAHVLRLVLGANTLSRI